MKLKVYFLALVALVMATSCVDENYDLSKVSFDDVEIGSEDTTISMPLATITITGDDLDGNGNGTGVVATSASSSAIMPTRSDVSYGFTEILELINAFLPTGETVDISILIADDEDAKESEIERLVNLLIDELQSSEQKVADLASVIYSYKDYVNLTSFTDSNNGVLNLKDEFTEVDIIDAINEYVLYTEDDYDQYIKDFADAVVALIDDEVVSQLKEYSKMEIDQEVESVELPSDIIDILGGDEETVSIIATYTHNFPFTFDISEIVFTGADGVCITISLTSEGEEPVVNSFTLSEISSVLSDGSTLNSGISLKTYTSIAVGDYAITIKISIQKTGNLKF